MTGKGAGAGGLRRVVEPAAVIEAIATQTGAGVERVRTVVAAARDAVDALLGDDYSVIAPPLCLMWPDDPVAERLLHLLKQWDKPQVAAFIDLEALDEQAHMLGLPADLLDDHPIAFDADVLGAMLPWLGLQVPAGRDNPEAVEVESIYLAWTETFANGRPYRVSSVGLERHLEEWLIQNMDRLSRCGYPVRLGAGTPQDPGGAQWVFSEQRQRPDLICRLVEDTQWGATGDWLVIELKAGGGYAEAVEQLAGYVTTVSDELAGDGEKVFGLLITDGAPPDVRNRLTAGGLAYLPLQALGYRDMLVQQRTMASSDTGMAAAAN